MSSVPPDRRRFLAGMAGGIAGLAATACAGPLQSAAATVAQAGAAPASGSGTRATSTGVARKSWDDSWTTRLGAHRMVFDVPDMTTEPGAEAVPDVMDAFHEVLGTTDKDLGVVLVIRHLAVPLFMSDALWAKYDIPALIRKRAPKAEFTFTTSPARALILTLQQRGVTVLGCDRAVRGLSMMAASSTKADKDAVTREVMAGIMPGVILQPNGLYALARAQDVGCGFMR